MRLKLIYILPVLFGINLSLKAQVNLVPNPGFEIYNECPDDKAQLVKAVGWFECKESCDYFNSCSVMNVVKVPDNAFGQQSTHNGSGYIGINTYTKKQFDAPPPYDPVLFWDGTMEMPGVKLNNKLKTGMKYTCGFYASRSDSCWYATKNLGMLFTADSLYLPQGSGWQGGETLTNHLIYELDPQIRYSDTAYLSDRLGWMKIEGSFIANGTEEFLYIGNFDPNANTDTLMVFDSTYNAPTTIDNWKYAYYYIDDVWVYEDSTTAVNEMPIQDISIYPNPAQEFVSVNMPVNYNQAQLSIYNLTGQLIIQKQLTQPNQAIPVIELSNGTYILVIRNEDKITGRQRVVVIK